MNVKKNDIAKTCYNAPTSYMYGQIRFGNKKNVALCFVKNKNKTLDYNLLDEIQKENIDNELKYYVDELKMKYTIDLNNILEKDEIEREHNYCGTVTKIDDHYIIYNDIKFWDLDNL